MNDNRVFSVSFDKELNHFTSEMENQVYLRVYKSMFTSGLVAEMKLHNFATLMAIASYMNEDGECFPTQQQLADRMGVHVNSVNKYVNQLLAFEVSGKPIITREVINRGRGKVSSYYKIHPISQLAIFNGEVETLSKEPVKAPEPPKPKKELSARDLVTKYQEIYREQYGVNFNPSWGRDVSLMKKLKDTYEEEVLLEILEIAITEFDSRWKTTKFPRPTIGAIVSFIADQAQAIILDRKKEDKQFAEFEEKKDELAANFEDKLSKLESI